MKIYLSQVYIEVDVNYSFTHHFQHLVSSELSKRVIPSRGFLRKYGEDYEVMFRMSSKAKLHKPELRGPTVFKKDKAVEYTIFLPFEDLRGQPIDSYRPILNVLMDSIIEVLEKLKLDTTTLAKDGGEIVDKIISSPEMLEE